MGSALILNSIELPVNTKITAGGWALVDGCFLRAGENEFSVSLMAEGSDGARVFFAVPITLKGRVLELFKLPPGTVQLRLVSHTNNALVVKDVFSVKSVSKVASRLLMWRRVLLTVFKQPRRQRRVAGLTVWSALFFPARAYRLVGKARHFSATPSYPEWIALNEQFTRGDQRRLRRFVRKPEAQSLKFEVIIDARSGLDQALVCASLATLTAQLGISARCQVLVSNEPSAAPSALVDGEVHRVTESQLYGVLEANATDYINRWIVFIAQGTRLAPWALAWFAVEAVRPRAGLIYGDHDYLVNGKREVPQFKPDWSQELARASGFVGSTFAVADDVLLRCVQKNELPSAYGLILSLANGVGGAGVRHIPSVLSHEPASLRGAQVRYSELEDHLRELGVNARVETQGAGLRIRYTLPKILPKVSIVVPTKDALNFLQTCVNSVLTKTTWPDYELLIVDNQSSDPAALAVLASFNGHPQVRVLRYNKPFNFSAINNFAVEHAQGDVICLLNNDTEVISPDWLEEMVCRLAQTGVGAVGARLYFRDGRVQHAGDVLGPGGCAAHLHGVIAGDDPGYMHRAVLPQELSAVTAACLVTWRNLYQRLDGLNARHLPVAFNDVDYCLRLVEAGYRVVYTPYAELYHYESVSRGKDDNPEKQKRAAGEVAYMRRQWGHVIQRDPFYNPNLNYSRPDFKLGKVRRVSWPW